MSDVEKSKDDNGDIKPEELEDSKSKITDIDKILGTPESESNSDTDENLENTENALNPEINLVEPEINSGGNESLKFDEESNKKDDSVLNTEIQIDKPDIDISIEAGLKSEVTEDITNEIECAANNEFQVEKPDADISVAENLKNEITEDTNKEIQLDKPDFEISVEEGIKSEITEDINKEVERVPKDEIDLDKSDIYLSVDEGIKSEITEDIIKEVESVANDEIQVEKPDIDISVEKDLKSEIKEDTNIEAESAINTELQIDKPDIEISVDGGLKSEVPADINIEIESSSNVEMQIDKPDIESGVDFSVEDGLTNEIVEEFLKSEVKLECEIDLSGNSDVTIDLDSAIKKDTEENLELDLKLEAEVPNVDLNLENVGEEINLGIVIPECDATVDIELSNKDEMALPDLSLNVEVDVGVVASVTAEIPQIENNCEAELGITLPEFSVGEECLPSSHNVGMEIEECLPSSDNVGIGIEADMSNMLPSNDVENIISVDISAAENAKIEVEFPDLGFDNSIDECPNSIDIKAELPSIGINFEANNNNDNRGTLDLRTNIHNSKECSLTSKLKDADIHILVDMDEITKKAVFRIDMANSWSKEVVDKDDERYNLDLKSHIKGDLVNGIDGGMRRKDKLNVEIGMYIGKENLEDSTVFACINSKSILGSKEYESVSPKKSHAKTSETSETSPDSRPKRYDFRYQLPKIEFPLFGTKSTDGADSGDPDKRKDVDVTQPERSSSPDERPKRYDFRFQLPKLDFLSFGSDDKSTDDNEVVANDNTKSEVSAKVDVKEPVVSPPKRYDFRFQLPKIDLFDSDESPSETDVKSKKDDGDLQSHISTTVPDSRIVITIDEKQQRPNIERPGIEEKIDVDNAQTKDEFSFNLPKIELPSLFGKEKADAYMDVDLDTRKSDIDTNTSTIESPTKRYDFRFQLPKIELPSLVWKPNSHNAISDIDIDTNKSYINADLEIVNPDAQSGNDEPPKRYDFRFKLPSVEIPLFGNKTPTESEVNADIGVPAKNDPSNIIIEVKLDDEKAEYNGDVTLKDDSESQSPTKRYDFRFQLPKFGLLSFDDKEKVTETEADVLLKIPDIAPDSEAETRRYNFSFTFPEVKFRINDGKVQFPKRNTNNDEDHNEFSLIFDGGDSDKGCSFEIKLEYGLLICRECFNGDWQQDMTSSVVCKSPEKNMLVAVLPLRGDGKLLVIFNDEILVKYSLKGCVNILQSFTINGAVKLNSVTLCDE